MLLNKIILNPLLKVKPLCIIPGASFSAGGFYDERRVIGKREWVGYGIGSSPNYVDRVEFPMPAVRFQEITGDLVSLREKEKGDWKKLSIDEKKKLYRTSFCQTFAEINAPTGEWKSIMGSILFFSGVGMAIFIILRLYVLPPLPPSFSEEARREQLRSLIVNRDGHLTGVSSKWDYEKDDWK